MRDGGREIFACSEGEGIRGQGETFQAREGEEKRSPKRRKLPVSLVLLGDGFKAEIVFGEVKKGRTRAGVSIS